MHKKSIEASQKLKEEEERTVDDDLSRLMKDTDTHRQTHGDQDRRSESIALLRAKAQSYSARMLHGLAETRVTSQHSHVTDFSTSGFQSPSITMVTTGC